MQQLHKLRGVYFSDDQNTERSAIIFEQNEFYYGNLLNGQMEGPGLFVAQNGVKIFGNFKQGELGGNCKLFDHKIQKYVYCTVEYGKLLKYDDNEINKGNFIEPTSQFSLNNIDYRFYGIIAANQMVGMLEVGNRFSQIGKFNDFMIEGMARVINQDCQVFDIYFSQGKTSEFKMFELDFKVIKEDIQTQIIKYHQVEGVNVQIPDFIKIQEQRKISSKEQMMKFIQEQGIIKIASKQNKQNILMDIVQRKKNEIKNIILKEDKDEDYNKKSHYEETINIKIITQESKDENNNKINKLYEYGEMGGFKNTKNFEQFKQYFQKQLNPKTLKKKEASRPNSKVQGNNTDRNTSSNRYLKPYQRSQSREPKFPVKSSLRRNYSDKELVESKDSKEQKKQIIHNKINLNKVNDDNKKKFDQSKQSQLDKINIDEAKRQVKKSGSSKDGKNDLSYEKKKLRNNSARELKSDDVLKNKIKRNESSKDISNQNNQINIKIKINELNQEFVDMVELEQESEQQNLIQRKDSFKEINIEKEFFKNNQSQKDFSCKSNSPKRNDSSQKINNEKECLKNNQSKQDLGRKSNSPNRNKQSKEINIEKDSSKNTSLQKNQGRTSNSPKIRIQLSPKKQDQYQILTLNLNKKLMKVQDDHKVTLINDLQKKFNHQKNDFIKIEDIHIHKDIEEHQNQQQKDKYRIKDIIYQQNQLDQIDDNIQNNFDKNRRNLYQSQQHKQLQVIDNEIIQDDDIIIQKIKITENKIVSSQPMTKNFYQQKQQNPFNICDLIYTQKPKKQVDQTRISTDTKSVKFFSPTMNNLEDLNQKDQLKYIHNDQNIFNHQQSHNDINTNMIPCTKQYNISSSEKKIKQNEININLDLNNEIILNKNNIEVSVFDIQDHKIQNNNDFLQQIESTNNMVQLMLIKDEQILQNSQTRTLSFKSKLNHQN